jgi:hypothetical protein
MQSLGNDRLRSSRLGDGAMLSGWMGLETLVREKGCLVLVQNKDFVVVPAT